MNIGELSSRVKVIVLQDRSRQMQWEESWREQGRFCGQVTQPGLDRWIGGKCMVIGCGMGEAKAGMGST